MKQIVAIVRPFLAEQVLENLRSIPIEALNVTEVKGYGRQKSYLDRYAQNEYSLAFLPKIEISLWVEEAMVSETVKKIVEIARSGRMGDGKIFVIPAPISLDIASMNAGESAGLLSSILKPAPSPSKSTSKKGK